MVKEKIRKSRKAEVGTLNTTMLADLEQLQNTTIGVPDEYIVMVGPLMGESYTSNVETSGCRNFEPCDFWGGGCAGGCTGCDSYD